jgi:PAS domain S-box-containing protein
MNAPKTIKNTTEALLFRGVSPDATFEVRSKTALIHTATAICGFLAIPFGIYAFIGGNTILGWADTGVAALLIIVDSFFVNTSRLKPIRWVSISIFFLFFYYLTISGGFKASGYIWSFTLPFYIMFLVGPVRATSINGLFLLLVMLFFFWDIPASSGTYSIDMKVRYCGSFFSLIILAYFVERIFRGLLNGIQEKNRALEAAVESLERKRRSLIQSERRLRDITLSSFDTIWEIDRECRYVDISGRIESVLGYTADTLVGKTAFSYMPPREAEKAQAAFAQAIIDKKGIADLERGCTHRNGSTIHLLTNALPILNEKNLVIGFRGVDKDITERKRAEGERAEMQEHLLQSRKMDAIGQLAGGLAHEFNNKMSIVMGYVEILKMHLQGCDADITTSLQRIMGAAEKTANLTTKLLAFARKGRHVVATVNLHDTIRDVVKLVYYSAGSAIAVEQDLRARNPMIMGDLGQIQSALIALTDNAREAMAGGGTLTYATADVLLEASDFRTRRLMLNPGPYCRLSVSDTGVGIAESDRVHLFEPFFSGTKFGERTGMGLASVYGITKSHNGAIEVESSVGAGTTFVLYLPVTEEKRSEKSSPAAAPARPGIGTILLVEDEEYIREFIQKMLHRSGYAVVACADGCEAVEFFKAHHADISVVILDVIMPRLAGYGCFMELRRIDPLVKVIITSGYPLEGEAVRMLAEGAREFIQKPFSSADLVKILQKVID